MDTDLLRVLQLIHDLGEQLTHNQKVTAALQTQANALRTQASNSVSGFALRRFNTDLSKEFFESELERTNAQIVIENQTLLHENKQLSLLLKEYESTMDTIMAKFRNHALAAQQHELTLTRHYEGLLLARESQMSSNDLALSINTHQSLHRLSHSLRNLLRSMAGENPSNLETDNESQETASINPEELFALVDTLDDKNSAYPGTEGRQDWALEREYEIERLERENEELRHLLGIDPESISATGMDMDAEIARMDAPRHPELSERARNAGNGHGPPGDSSYWETNSTNGGNGVSLQQQIFQPPASPTPNPLPPQQQSPQNGQGAPLQRMDLPRMLQNNRRSGIFGGGQAPRGLVVGTGRGLPNAQVPLPNLWTNQPPSPAVPLTQDRPWSGAVDANR